jgi:thymidine kinase
VKMTLKTRLTCFHIRYILYTMSLDIIVGPMFSGKSSRVADIVSRYTALGSRVLLIHHADDIRYGHGHITHNQRVTNCFSTHDLGDIPMELLEDANVILVDEAQFFHGLVPFCEMVVDTMSKKLYLVGLDGDSNRRRFGEILDCIPLADRVEKLTAFCRRCANGTPGIFTYRRSGPDDQQVIIGGCDMYETLCRECFFLRDINA